MIKGGNSYSFMINLVSFRTFRCFLVWTFLPFLTANRLQPTILALINVFSFTGITIFLIMKPNLAYGQINCSALYIAAYVPTSLGPFFVSQISILRWIIVRTKIRECTEQEKTRKKIVVTLLILGLMYHAICFSIGIKHGLPLGILQQVFKLNSIQYLICCSPDPTTTNLNVYNLFE